MRVFWYITVAAIATFVLLAYSVGVDVARLPRDRSAVSFTDRTGAPLGVVSASDDNHAAWVPLDRVAPAFLAAIIATEDARYYQHGAIDWLSLARAVREYVVFGEARSGGSTIAMQLARSVWPTPSTIRGKLAQVAGAERITLRSSPSAILEAYVNRIPMGGNLYGVEAAARSYFGVPARDLDLAQAALLAAIPNDPAGLSPYDRWAALRRRQRYVLERMVLLGDIAQVQASAASTEQVHLLPRNGGLIAAQHLLFWLYPQLPVGTAQVRTTIDGSLQRFVQTQVAAVVAALGERHVTDAAALVVDNQTGDVLAYAGSPDYFADSALGRNDGVQALRQPGSSLKPFTYELALERGTIRSTTILADVPTTYAIPGGKLYEPADYSTRFAGPVRVRYALANSLNVPAVRVLESVGVETLLARLHQLGFAHLNKPAAFYGLGLTLGSGEVSLWELTHAYTTIARGGSAIPLRTRADEPPASPTLVGDPQTWSLVTDMLADPHARAQSFGLHSVLEMPFPAAVKTGTSSDFRDTWTVGFSRDYTVGVWVGNFDGSAMRGVSGVTGAGPLWNRIMLHLHEAREPRAFSAPAGYVNEPICVTTGRRPDKTCRAVVLEWIRPADLWAWQRSAPVAARDQDLWLAEQPNARIAGVRIAFPRGGNTFVYDADVDALARASQRIELRAIGEGRPIRWTVGGAALRADSSGSVFWPLRLGTWNIVATDGARRDSVTVHVVQPPHGSHPGFSFTTRR
jgi:penicillin-binding protein 1C